MDLAADKLLGDRLSRGDIAVLGDLLPRYGPPIAAVLTRDFELPLDDADVDDILATTMLKAWQGRTKFRPGSNPWPWLMEIAKNTAIDLIRGRAGTVELDAEQLIDSRSMEESAEDSERVRKMRLLLAQLSDDDRDILRLGGDRNPKLLDHVKSPTGKTMSDSDVRVRRYRLIERLRRGMMLTEQEISARGKVGRAQGGP